MRFKNALMAACGLVALSACSMHPLPEDFAIDNTRSIVQKIRCEVRDAITKQVIEHLQQSIDDSKFNSSRYGITAANVNAAKHIINRIHDDGPDGYTYKDFLSDVTSVDLHYNSLRIILYYTLTGLTLNFEFDITERNDNNVDVGFQMPVPGGTFKLDLGAKDNNKRQATRTVKIDDDFPHLYEKTIYRLNDGTIVDECDKNKRRFDKTIYPITGNIGLDEVVKTFIYLSERSEQLTLYQDKLIYTTELEGSITPNFTVTPTSPRLKLAKASGALLSNRLDKHTLDITLAVPDKAKADKLIKAALAARAGAKTRGRKRVPPRQFVDQAMKLSRDAAEKASNARHQQLIDKALEDSAARVAIPIN